MLMTSTSFGTTEPADLPKPWVFHDRTFVLAPGISYQVVTALSRIGRVPARTKARGHSLSTEGA
jgi:hypothetical protein